MQPSPEARARVCGNLPGAFLAGLLLVAWSHSAALAEPGVEFWALLSEQANRQAALSIVVGNPDPSLTATVVIETETGPVVSASVPSRTTRVIDLGTARKVYGSVLARFAYRIRSDVPIHAYQVLDYSLAGHVAAAALLLPTSRLGTNYMVLAQSDPTTTLLSPSLVTIAAPFPARVTIVTTFATSAGPGIPSLQAGVPYTTDLQPFDVLQLAALPLGDLTGTTVSSTAPIEVFAGCNACHWWGSAADNVQELQLPLAWWGTSAVAVSTAPLTTDTNVFRIVAAQDGTWVTTDPLMPGMPVTLDRGRFRDVLATADFAVNASGRIALGRFTTACAQAPLCDPALCMMLPEPVHTRGAVFSLPDAPAAIDWVDIVARPGTTVTVDGAALAPSAFRAVGTSGWLHAQVPLDPTQVDHAVEGDAPIAVYAETMRTQTAATFPIDASPSDAVPVCNTGGPYTAACAGLSTPVLLDGGASVDPEGLPLTFLWSVVAGSVTLDDPTSRTPVARVAGPGQAVIALVVGDGLNVTRCMTTIDVIGGGPVPPAIGTPLAPLLLAKSGLLVRFSWGDLGSGFGYNLYEGTLRGIWTHSPLACDSASVPSPPDRREAVLAPAAGSRYYLMTAASCGGEGPSGADPAPSACPP